MKKVLSLILAIIMIMSLVACGGAPATNDAPAADNKVEAPVADNKTETPATPAEPKYAEEVTIALPVGSLDPNLIWGLDVNGYQIMVFETLLTRDDETGELHMKLAKSVEWANEECSKLHVILRDDIFFSNGDPVTAADVAYTMDRVVYGSVATYYDSSEIVSDTELDINLTGPCSTFMPILSIGACGVVNKAAAEANPDGLGLIGSGPWAYDMSTYLAENSITLVRNENYWGEFESPTKKVNFVKIADASAAAVALKTGDVHFAKDLQATELPGLEQNKDLVVSRFPATNFIEISCNDRLETDSLTEEEINLRRAVACAINKEEILVATGNEMGQTMTSMWRFDDPSYIANESDYEHDLSYNPEKAKEYLSKAGGKTDVLMWFSSTEPGVPVAAQIIQEQCRQVGINVELYEIDGSSFTAAVRSGTIPEYDMVVWRNSFNYDVINFNHYLTTSSVNRAFLNSSKAYAAMDIINNSSDTATRNEQVKVMQTAVHDTVSIIPLYFREMNNAMAAGLEGAYHNSVPVYDFTNVALRVE